MILFKQLITFRIFIANQEKPSHRLIFEWKYSFGKAKCYFLANHIFIQDYLHQIDQSCLFFLILTIYCKVKENRLTIIFRQKKLVSFTFLYQCNDAFSVFASQFFFSFSNRYMKKVCTSKQIINEACRLYWHKHSPVFNVSFFIDFMFHFLYFVLIVQWILW